VARRVLQRPRAAAVLGGVGFLLIGWSGLLVPSLIRSIEGQFGQTDAGIGLFYFLGAGGYVAGSFVGGFATERLGRRWVLSVAAMLVGLGLLAMGAAPSWPLFLLAALPLGLGSGAIDGGVNGLVLDLYPTSRGQALNRLHLFFSLGALAAPLTVGRLVDAGVPWQAVVLGTALVAFPLAGLFALADLPSGRHIPGEASRSAPIGYALPLIFLAVAIACYVASELGVSSWLVRFLDPAPLSTATAALSLYWAGLTLGRLVSARVADRFDHLQLAIVSSLVAATTLVVAVASPSLAVSVALFGLVGFASGPVYPLIMAIGGDRFPDRSAAVSGFLAGTAVIGSILYPPIMGFMSVTIGLTAAMLGTALLGFACAGALIVSGRTVARA
jgi:fucose permease